MPDNSAILEGVRRGLITPEQARGMLQPKPSMAADVAKSVGSGLVRGTPKLIDFAVGLGGEGINLGAKAIGAESYPVGQILGNTHELNQVVSKALGPEYEPEYRTGHVAKFLAELVSPGSLGKLLKGSVGLAKGAAGSMEGYLRDPEALKQLYLSWKSGLDKVPLGSKEVAENLVNPAVESIGKDAKYATEPGKQKLNEFVDLWANGGDMGDVYALQKSLKNVNDPAITEPIRNATKGFMESRVGTEGLDQYRRYATSGEVSHALRNQGNEGMKATRTKINNLDESGMTPAELAAKKAAGRGGLAEALMRGTERVTGAIPSAIVAGPFAPLVYGTGKLAGKVADKLAEGKIRALQEVLLNGRPAPGMGEKTGNALRQILMRSGV